MPNQNQEPEKDPNPVRTRTIEAYPGSQQLMPSYPTIAQERLARMLGTTENQATPAT